MELEKFIQNNTPKKKISIFDDYIKDINKLLELNYSQKQVIEFLQSKVKNKAGLSEPNLSKYLKKSRNKITPELNNSNKEKLENVIKENSNKKPIDIFANLKKVNDIETSKEIETEKKSSFQEDAMSFFRSLKDN